MALTMINVHGMLRLSSEVGNPCDLGHEQL
jgi:hypothetical protein